MKLLFLFILLYSTNLSSSEIHYNMADPNMRQFITKPGKSRKSVYDKIYPWYIKHSSGY